MFQASIVGEPTIKANYEENIYSLPLEGGGTTEEWRKEFKSDKTLLPQSLTHQLPQGGAHA